VQGGVWTLIVAVAFAAGLACLAPPLIAVYLLARYHVVGFGPWIPELLIAMALIGVGLIVFSAYVRRAQRLST